jgi:hypothetical protein
MQQATASQELQKSKLEATKLHTQTLQQLNGTLHTVNQVRSERDATIAARDSEVRANLALKARLYTSIDATVSAKRHSESLTHALSDSKVNSSRLEQELSRTNTTLKDTKKELASTKKDAALTKQVLVKQRDEVKKELATVKMDASVTEKFLKNKNEEGTKELALVKTDAAVTEKLLENKVLTVRAY